MPDQTTISFAEALLDAALSIIEDLKLRQWGYSEAARAILLPLAKERTDRDGLFSDPFALAKHIELNYKEIESK